MYNNIMNVLAKLLFFISSYIPLIFILLINSNFKFNEVFVNFTFTSFFISFIIFLLLVSIFFLFWILQDRNVNPTKINFIKVENKTSETLSYILPYVVAFYQVDFLDIKNLLIFLIIFITIFAVYINSNLIAVNPILAILGYKIFIIESKRGEHAYIITKRTLVTNDKYIRASLILSNIYIEKGE